MKVVMIGGYPLNKIYGGVAVHIAKLTHQISLRSDVELHIITFGTENNKVKKNNLTIHIVREPKELRCIPLFIPLIKIWLLMCELSKIAPDVVHGIGTYYPYSTAAMSVRNKYPTLLTVHGIIEKEIKYVNSNVLSHLFGELIAKPNEKYVLSKIPNIITVSPHVKDWVSNRTNSNIYVIPNGVDFDEIQSIRTKDKLKHPAILFVGGLDKVKGIDVLLNAVPIIIKKIPDLHIYIAGSGPEESKLKKLVKRLNIEKCVVFLGFISGKEKYAYYKSADIYVHPSRYETFGIAILEAMACGKPVVASNVSGIPFVVKDGKTGLLFECCNIEDLAEKIIVLLENKELREQMGEAGRKRAKEFTWDKIAEKTIALYKAIISEKRGGKVFRKLI